MKFTINKNGHLLIELETPEDKEWARETLASRGGDDNLFVADLLEYTGWQPNGKLVKLSPVAIGALTQAPLVTDLVEYGEDGKIKTLGNLYWFPHYEGTHFGEHLLMAGYIGFMRTTVLDVVNFKAEVPASTQVVRNVLEAAEAITSDLAGYATKVAVRELTSSWVDSLIDNNPAFYLSSMQSDIEAVIENLQALKLGLSSTPDAGKQLMRKKLGLD